MIEFVGPIDIRVATNAPIEIRLPDIYLLQRAMATSASSSLGPAPWRKLFLEHIQTVASPEFTLSTVRKISSSYSPSGAAAKGSYYYAPRARTCVFRGLFAELPANPKNEARLNPPGVYESDLLTFTTDRRMDKMAELFGVGDEEMTTTTDGSEKREGRRKITDGSGGGAPVEAVFWAKEAGTQWRVRGKAYVLAPDVEDSAAGREVISTLTSRMRVLKNTNTDTDNAAAAATNEWSFSREITAHFGNLSPLMRGSFRNPPPGTPVAAPVGDDRLRLGQRVTDLGDEVARANFRVVVIVPEGVDRTDLRDPERGRRWLYTYVGGGKSESTAPGGVVEDGWEEVEVWP
ncbi:pyridoxamine 5'-phosphate oxidase-domain-containing protein [Daldinia caldariorum]|uniref:pyridoxamine 5'-phosphate oxidase-domain-containing protein n=1 Tax=Daldinia caldariorum TaxID=326644 RepID=UPI002008622F|nr:pyridoxamine 5'-phosphate oxidase-domain-containing protein [Daldinia caldariorum]KAI1465877.1 pyridoxamine 5'-phosphate oxidase-domain-containing protein [Daldinia caldariorum]